MTRRITIAAALLLLSACGGNDAPRVATPPESPEIAACRQEARNARMTPEIARQMNLADPTQMDRTRDLQAASQERAFNDCLRDRGVLRGGGVEPIRRR